MTKPISQLLSAAKYKHPEHTKQDILNATKYIKTLHPKLEKYTFPTGVSKELICLDGTIPVTFRDATYNIPIGIFISDNHPFEAPLCYVRPTRDMTIKTSRHVDGSGRVYLPYLSDWNRNTSDILSTIQVMQIVFGQMCPVYQKAKGYDTTPNNVAMPPALPTTYYPNNTSVGGSSTNSGPSTGSITMPTPPTPVYPFSSQQEPYSPTSQTQTTGTITEEHIRASLLSAVEDRLKYRMKEKIHQIQDEIEVLKKTSNDLNRGKMQLDDMKTRMAQEIESLTAAKQKLSELDDQLQEFIVKYDKEGEEIDPDEVYGPTQPLYKQLLDAFAEENAVVDAIYYTGEGLRKGKISLEVFLKNVRDLSRRQFMLRALMRACRAKASLPN
jgi:ESCRT-I complex subunit TSG101